MLCPELITLRATRRLSTQASRQTTSKTKAYQQLGDRGNRDDRPGARDAQSHSSLKSGMAGWTVENQDKVVVWRVSEVAEWGPWGIGEQFNPNEKPHRDELILCLRRGRYTPL